MHQILPSLADLNEHAKIEPAFALKHKLQYIALPINLCKRELSPTWPLFTAK